MPKKPKLLFIGDFETQDDSVRRSLNERFQIVTVANLWRAVHLLRQDAFDAIHVLESPETSLLQAEQLTSPQGVKGEASEFQLGSSLNPFHATEGCCGRSARPMSSTSNV